MLTTLDDTIRAVLESPDEQTYRLGLVDRLQEEADDPHAAALDLVLRHPEHDGPRHVYAEWCDRNGRGQRAVAVREGLRGQTAGGRCGNLRQVGSWDIPWEWSDEWALGVSRGFVHHMTLTGPDWALCGHEIRRRHPVTSVTLESWPVLETHLEPGVPYGARVSLEGLERAVAIDEKILIASRDLALTAAARKLLELEFPGVQFLLPPAVNPASWGVAPPHATPLSDLRYWQERMVGQMAKANGLPAPPPKMEAEPEPRLAQVDGQIELLRRQLLGYMRVRAHTERDDDHLRTLRETLAELREWRARAAADRDLMLGVSDVRQLYPLWRERRAGE